MKKPLALIILDGWGLSPAKEGNAIAQAKTPNFDRFYHEFPNTRLEASGRAVGLPVGQMGNSEVGHLNIGAGRIVYQDITRISKSIEDGDFFENPVFKTTMQCAVQGGGRLHLMGLCSDGGVHSLLEHAYALLGMAKERGVKQTYFHCFMDGRDVPPSSGEGYLKEVEAKLAEMKYGKIATVMGRYWAMDRDKRWDRVERAYRAMVMGEGLNAPDGPSAARQSYEKNETDEFIAPTVIDPEGTIQEGDSIIFFNFRPDRAREISRALTDPHFNGFERPLFRKVCYACMTQYDVTLGLPIAYPPQSLDCILAEVLADHNLRQLHIAETEKYAHVTFFFNGGKEAPFPNEERVLVPSPKVPTYDQQPEMSAPGVTEEVLKHLPNTDVLIVNFANPDMVGHTGVMSAAVQAIETVDSCLGKIVEAVQKAGGVAIITADHGNAERMVDTDGGPFTAHTTDPVPFILVGYPAKLREDGVLADIAPTMLQILDIPQPGAMTGKTLLQ
ncbi:MAG: 2,3-bisphosphoglycerate-independent phosphoglycerate mutase [Bacteroidota bacterium]